MALASQRQVLDLSRVLVESVISRDSHHDLVARILHMLDGWVAESIVTGGIDEIDTVEMASYQAVLEKWLGRP